MSQNPLKKLFGTALPIEDHIAVRPGRTRVTGVVRLGSEPLKSPIRGVQCVAFFYRAYYSVQGRTGWAQRTLRRAEVYAPDFALEMKGGNVRVLPKKRGAFSAEEHRDIAAGGLPQFKAEEQAVRPGDRVVIKGRVFEDDEGLAIRPSQIEILDARPPRPPRSAARSKKRLKSKRK